MLFETFIDQLLHYDHECAKKIFDKQLHSLYHPIARHILSRQMIHYLSIVQERNSFANQPHQLISIDYYEIDGPTFD